ncbi:MAG: hypothetical protein A3F10_04745 [Coxiella sp. RIFCSPHIGHO2_12_FULL_42_15]|nr:MAG: hypothetical protein A3F10_04745 [Coxiella sp. RIFCSPHIGHO2_12_FULL_42_15]
MNDQNKQVGDEYQYPGEEYVVEPSAQPTEEEAPVKKSPEQPAWKKFVSNNRRKLLVVLVIMIVLVVFQIMKHKENNKVIMQAPEQPAPTQTLPTQQPSQDQALLQQSLASIQQNGDANAQEISLLKSQVDDMRAQMQQANETNDQLKQAMVLLLQELRNVNENIKVNVSQKSGPPQPVLVYSVRAIVDGRAWILGSNGLAISVTVGDPIPGYGNVTGIYPGRGLITTNTGKDIRLGQNDF